MKTEQVLRSTKLTRAAVSVFIATFLRWNPAWAILIGLIFSSPLIAAARDWPTTDFEVLVVDEGSHASVVIREALAAVGLEAKPLGRKLPDETRKEIETLLHRSAAMLIRWGFPPPRLRTQFLTNNKYRVFITGEISSTDAAGIYHGYWKSLCEDKRAPAIFLDARHVLKNDRLTNYGRMVVAHELVHAVQYNTPFFQTPCDSSDVGHWITEGTAEAVGWDIARSLDAAATPGSSMDWGMRSYTDPLPIPLRRGLLPESRSDDPRDPYATSSFWRYLAETYSARNTGGPRPGPSADTPFDYGYLAKLFDTAPPGRDCYQEGAPCTSELRWLDHHLRQVLGAPLHDLYTRFVATAALYSERSLDGRVRDKLFGQWRRTLFSLCAPVELTPASPTHIELGVDVLKTGAKCYAVTLKGFEDAKGDGKDLNLYVSAEAPANAAELSDLSVIAARTEARGDLPLVSEPQRDENPEIDPDSERSYVESMFGQTADSTSYILITNVANDPAQTKEMKKLDVTFTVVKEYASMGTGGGAGVPGIDTPLPIEFTNFRSVVLKTSAIDNPATAGGKEVCQLSWNFDTMRSVPSLKIDLGDSPIERAKKSSQITALRQRALEDADAAAGSIFFNGPIKKGSYPISYAGISKNRSPGVASTSFHLGHNSASTAGWRFAFSGMGGTLTIDHVSRHVISGQITITGDRFGDRQNYGGCVDPDRRALHGAKEDARCPMARTLSASIKFSVRPERGIMKTAYDAAKAGAKRTGNYKLVKEINSKYLPCFAKN